MLSKPLKVASENGKLTVMKKKAKKQKDMGEALTLDTVVNSIDAELIATGPSAKGPNRGAILRHGPFVLWGFQGPVSDMTPAGQALFVNTVHYTAKQKARTVLETRRNGTRDSLFGSLEFAKRVPGYLNTMKRLYLPNEMKDASHQEVHDWLTANRGYLSVNGRRIVLDPFAKQLRIPNHKKAFLEACIKRLKSGKDEEKALKALQRYTGLKDMGASAKAWADWYENNKDYLFFSDCEGFVFKIDIEAKAAKKKTSDLRGWSSEKLDYTFRPPEADKK